MAVKLLVGVDDPDDVLAGYGASAKVKVQRAAVQAFTTPVDVTEITVEAAKYQYEYWDIAGVTGDWYRTRFQTSAGGSPSDWTDPFQPGSPESYATIDDLLVTFRSNVTDTKHLNRLQDLLETATGGLIDDTGWDFYRHPLSGTEVRYFAGDGRDRLCIHDGLVSVSQLEISTDGGQSWVVVPAADYVTEPLTPTRGYPFDHIRMLPGRTYAGFPAGVYSVRVTGVFGWSRIPRVAKEANIARARQLAAADPSLPGGIVGPEEFGSPAGPNRVPDNYWRLVRHWATERWCHL